MNWAQGYRRPSDTSRRIHPAIAELLPFLLGTLQARMRRTVDHELAEVGLSWRDLLILIATRSLQTVSQAVLVERTGIDRATVAGAIDDLASECLVRVALDPRDRRRTLIELTPSAAPVISEGLAAVARAEASVLGPDLQAPMRSLLQRAARPGEPGSASPATLAGGTPKLRNA